MSIPKRSRMRGGFTLTELMISASLIGVLASIAIPSYQTLQARSRRSEGYGNLSALARAFQAYYADKGRFPDMFTESGEPSLPDPTPYGGISSAKMKWDATTQAFFDIVGWQSDGSVFYTYDVSAPDGGLCSCIACFTATAHGDVDADGDWGGLMYAYPQRDADGNVTGECVSRVDPTGGGGLIAPAYEAVTVHLWGDDY